MDWLLLVIALLLIVANGFFVAAEFSLITVERSEVENRAADGDRTAVGILAGLRTLSTQLSGAQLGITVTSLLVGALAEPSLSRLLRPPLTAIGVPEEAVPAISVVLALVLATGFQMIFAELVPKNMAIAMPFAVARVSVPFQRGFTKATSLIIRLFNGMANAIVRALGVEPQEELASARSPQELRSLVRHSAQAGTLEAPTARLLARSLTFDDRSAADVLTPRGRVQFLDHRSSLSAAIAVVRATGHSSFPVTGPRGADEVVGVATLRRMLRVSAGERSRTAIESVMSEPLLVPESLPLDDLLTLLRSRGHMAVVVDEYGGTAGVVTLEDLVEELVGEVEDEHDVPSNPIVRRPDAVLVVSGLVRPDEVREWGVAAPDSSDYETIAGLVIDALERIAVVGDEVTVAGWTYRVVTMDGRRIDRIEIAGPPEKAEEPEEADLSEDTDNKERPGSGDRERGEGDDR